MMSPKAAARSFTRWARRQPDRGSSVMHFAQQPGSLPRGGIARSGTEAGFHTKAYLLPAALIGDHEVAGSFFVAYFLTGRFNLYKTYTQYPAALPLSGKPAEDNAAPLVGTKSQWTEYQTRFAALRTTGDAATLLPKHANNFPKEWSKATVRLDQAGGLWLRPGIGDAAPEVGIEPDTLLARGSDPRLAYQLMLCRVAYVLHTKGRMRESMRAFQEDWTLLERARARLLAGEFTAGTKSAQETAVAR